MDKNNKLIMLQPSAYVDQIRDGHEMTKLPYPFYVHPDGSIDRQDFWKGDPERVVGFVADPDVQRIDLWWTDAAEDPQRAVGMYVVTADSDGNYGTHETAVDSVKVIEPSSAVGQ